jgi:hypothetical protein
MLPSSAICSINLRRTPQAPRRRQRAAVVVAAVVQEADEAAATVVMKVMAKLKKKMKKKMKKEMSNFLIVSNFFGFLPYSLFFLFSVLLRFNPFLFSLRSLSLPLFVL